MKWGKVWQTISYPGMGVALLLLLASAAVALPDDTPPEHYVTRFDSIDVEDILNNDRLYKRYFECFRGSGRCTPDSREAKALLPDALKTHCAKCTEGQKERIWKVIKFMLEKKPDDFKLMEALYDPEGIYRNEAKNLGIAL